MTATTDDFDTFRDYTRRVLEPTARLNELAARHVERVARFQFELAGDWLNFGVEQWQAVARPWDLGTLLARNAEISGRFVERVARRQQDLAKLATDAQASFALWVEDTTAGKG